MSISSIVIALNLVLSPVTAFDSEATTYSNTGQTSYEIAQIPLDKYDDGIQAGRAELNRLINIVRTRPKLTAKQRATGVAKLYTRRAQELDQRISQGLDGTFILIENKKIIIQRWTTERDSLKRLALREIEPYLTARERKILSILNDPAQMKRIQEEAQRKAEIEQREREDAEKLRGIIPQ
jgi:hypothetical protein